MIPYEKAKANGHTLTVGGQSTKNQFWEKCATCGRQLFTLVDPTTNKRTYSGKVLSEPCSPITSFHYLYNPTTGMYIRNIQSPYRWILRHRKDIRYAIITYDPDNFFPIRCDVTVDDYIGLWFSFHDLDLAKRMLTRLVKPTMVRDYSGEDATLQYCMVP